TVVIGGSSCLYVDFNRPERSQRERTRREDRRSKFNGERDYLTSDSTLRQRKTQQLLTAE
ncbi:MAG: hypothetical protein ACRDK9_02245, partial [Solirubrobacterales bacterium]